MRSARSLVWFLWGILGIGLLLGSLTELSAPPKWFTISAAVGTIGLVITSSIRKLRIWRARQNALNALGEVEGDEGMPMRLLGSFAPYSIEAADRIATAKGAAAVPILMFAIERLMVERPGGWRKMTASMVAALRQIGDTKPLPLLRRLQRARGSEEIGNLQATILELENSVRLMRPARDSSDAANLLLRSTPLAGAADEQTVLLRSTDGPRSL